MVKELFTMLPELRLRRWLPSLHPEVDVVVSGLSGETIGVEVTRLLPLGQEARTWEMVQNRIVHRAAKQWLARQDSPVEVVVFWDAYTDPTKNRESTQAVEIVQFVEAHLPEHGDSWGIDAGDDRAEGLPRGIAHLEACVGVLEHGLGAIAPRWIDRPRRLPRRGTQMCNRERIRLKGQDLRPEGMAEGFALDLPKRTILRVEEFPRLGQDSEPVRTDLLNGLSASQRHAARAYGFALEIPPGLVHAQFEILLAAT